MHCFVGEHVGDVGKCWWREKIVVPRGGMRGRCVTSARKCPDTDLKANIKTHTTLETDSSVVSSSNPLPLCQGPPPIPKILEMKINEMAQEKKNKKCPYIGAHTTRLRIIILAERKSNH